jgi:putative hydrolase of the HAD superfamily
MTRFQIIAFDADDTLWQTERLYVRAQAHLKDLLAAYLVDDQMDERLFRTETRNLEHFGYGIKAFALSMIETSIELTGGRISAADIQSLIDSAKEMLLAPIELLDHVATTIDTLAATHGLMLITKGDLRDQETKLARSGLGSHFQHVEIVSDKRVETYRAILDRLATAPSEFMMVGNSLRSDILPVLVLGAQAVHIPHELTWAHEAAEAPAAQPGYHELNDIGELPALIDRLEHQTAGNS